jgi:hypothetical protein
MQKKKKKNYLCISHHTLIKKAGHQKGRNPMAPHGFFLMMASFGQNPAPLPTPVSAQAEEGESCRQDHLSWKEGKDITMGFKSRSWSEMRR